jgi:hypothetical protein
MKKFTVAVLILSIVLSLAAPCLAANSTDNIVKVAVTAPTTINEAQVLAKTDIFKGLSSDFKVAKGQLMRKEAARIITKLMSKETTVLLYKNQYPVDKVKDVKVTDENAPYIGFVIKQNLMSLDESGKFYPDKIISEKEFLSLLLKTLKYEEKTDYKYIDTYKFSYNIGIVKGESYKNKSFNNYFYSRKDAIAAIYNTLITKPKGSDSSFVSELIQNKVLTREMAEKAGLLKDLQATQIVDSKSISNTQIAITFNEPVGKVLEKDISIHGQDDTVGIFASTASNSGKTLVLNTTGQTPDKKYVVEFKSVEDIDGFVTTNLNSNFTGYKNYEIKSDLFKISKVEVESKSVINVFFTQPVTSNAETPMSYELFEGTTSYLKGSFQTMIPKVKKKYDNCISIYLREKDLKEGVSYKLKISGDLQSAYGVKLNDGSGDSVDIIGKTGENRAFDIVSVTPTDSKTILIEFSRDVDGTSACSTSNYSINGTAVPVNKASVSANGEGKNVILGLAFALTQGNNYELTINNVYDSFKQNSVNSVKYPFSGTTLQRDKIGIVGVTPMDKRSIAVYFDRPVDGNSAMNTGAYSISSGSTSPSAITAVSFDYNDPYSAKMYLDSDLASGQNYTLTVYNTLRDESGNMFSASATYSFSGSGTDNTRPVLYDARIIGSDTIIAKVSEDISSSINTTASNYSIEYKDGSNTKTQVASSVAMYNPSTVLIKFNSLSNSTGYTLRYNNLIDYTGLMNSGSTSVSPAQ